MQISVVGRQPALGCERRFCPASGKFLPFRKRPRCGQELSRPFFRDEMPHAPNCEQTLFSAIGNTEGMEETVFGTAVFAHHRPRRGSEFGEPWRGWCSFTHHSSALGTDYRCLRFAWTRRLDVWLQRMRGQAVWSLDDLIHRDSRRSTVFQKLFAQVRNPPSCCRFRWIGASPKPVSLLSLPKLLLSSG